MLTTVAQSAVTVAAGAVAIFVVVVLAAAVTGAALLIGGAAIDAYRWDVGSWLVPFGVGVLAFIVLSYYVGLAVRGAW